ncbi:MAG: deoxyuridine 5'-triphosphate nucleotidohydrolase [Haloferacaceae archaeon]
MFRAGAFVAGHVSPLAEDQIQPNGVDLTVATVLEQRTPGRIGREGKTVGDRRPVDADATDGYRLDPGGYVVQYGETVHVPEGHVGFILPRSSLLRNSTALDTAVWDAGYEGRGEGLLRVHHPIEIEDGARIGQFVLAAASHEGTYDGSYQGERTGPDDP